MCPNKTSSSSTSPLPVPCDQTPKPLVSEKPSVTPDLLASEDPETSTSAILTARSCKTITEYK